MSDIKELHSIIMQQAQTIAKLTDQLVSYVQTGQVLVPQTPLEEAPQYAISLEGSDLVREHFRRGGGALYCFYDDESDADAIDDDCGSVVAEVQADGRFVLASGNAYSYAVACDRHHKVLTASELLG